MNRGSEDGQMSASRGEDQAKHYDLFVSYKSEDALIVRMVAEQMRASGANVWFAEYSIQLEGREQFMAAIEKAIADSRYGICFTNDRFVSSEYCRREIELLLMHLGPERIIEIALPRQSLPHQRFPALSAAMSLDVPVPQSSEDDGADGWSATLPCSAVDRILEHIHRSTGLSLSGCGCHTPQGPDRHYYRSRGVSYSLDSSGWAMEKPGLLSRLIAWGGGADSLGAKFRRASEGGSLWGHLIVGKQDVPRKRTAEGTTDDREYYDDALAFARQYFGSIWKQKCIGVHLVFLCGLSHPAFSTLASSSSAVLMGRPVWSRLYSVVLPGPRGSGDDREFAFFFFCKGDLASFVRSAHCMDRLVLSLRLGGRPSTVRGAGVAGPRAAGTDDQTRRIIDHIAGEDPSYLRQVQWFANPLTRLGDVLLCGQIGKLLLARGKRESGPAAVSLLSRAVAASSSRKVMSVALECRANLLIDMGMDADQVIADFSLAIWCDPGNGWAREGRAGTYEANQHAYRQGWSGSELPMTTEGACADLESAAAFFTSLANRSQEPERRDYALRAAHKCQERLALLRRGEP